MCDTPPEAAVNMKRQNQTTTASEEIDYSVTQIRLCARCTIAGKMTMPIMISHVWGVMCSSHSGRDAVILRNPLLAISTDESAVIKAPYAPPSPPLDQDHPLSIVVKTPQGISVKRALWHPSAHCFGFITPNLSHFYFSPSAP